VVSAGYDEQALELELEFRSGHVYRYESVPPSVYAWLLRIENKGGFVRRMIQGRYVERAMPRFAPPASASGAMPASGAPNADALEDALRASLERLGKPRS
jgi:hypothetical protein